ncbi:lytic murein transglycosylase [Pseudodesulfovibrio sp.]|uniref:lytic murein transglycosylase n=1 Tax=unclassified Pseudodesulfovibrio TaxID=2661612 RepID=UPI003B001A2C
MYPWTEYDFTAERRLRRAAIVLTLAAVFFFMPLPVRGEGVDWKPLTDRLAADGFDRTYLQSLFARKSLEFDPKIMARKMNVLLAAKLRAASPTPASPPQVLSRYLNPILLAGGYAYFRENSDTLKRIQAKYDVPGEVLTALMLVETKLGTMIGDRNGFTILASMALAGNFELIRAYITPSDLSDEDMEWLVRRTEQKGNWAYSELKALITYAHNNGQDPLNIPSSVYGAIGLCQFIPSSAVYYGVDGTGDGRVDLFDNTDALYSIANFLKKHGWKNGIDPEAQLKIIYHYNHSQSYALTILEVADRIRKTSQFFGN